MIKLAIYWGGWAYFPFAVLCIWAILRAKPAVKVLASLALALTSVVAYARFIEPRRLEVHRETILLPGASETSPSIAIALFAGPHIGMFGNAMPIRRIVQRINAEGVDAVFLAGDLTYHPGPEDIPEDFASLSNSARRSIRCPAITISDFRVTTSATPFSPCSRTRALLSSITEPTKRRSAANR